jgi:5-hydroxyisourate hydrolase-like protein (transthyretin family)
MGYQVNLSGIGNRTVKFRLVTNTNAEFGYSLSNITADQNILAKGSYQTVNYQGNLAVTDYALEQNYPNPFNPSTTIKFQLPKDGMVSLKIYDILGNEISTLINEEKAQGRYEVNFNASSLASGVYIYKIQAGDFVNSKKMLLLK